MMSQGPNRWVLKFFLSNRGRKSQKQGRSSPDWVVQRWKQLLPAWKRTMNTNYSSISFIFSYRQSKKFLPERSIWEVLRQLRLKKKNPQSSWSSKSGMNCSFMSEQISLKQHSSLYWGSNSNRQRGQAQKLQLRQRWMGNEFSLTWWKEEQSEHTYGMGRSCSQLRISPSGHRMLSKHERSSMIFFSQPILVSLWVSSKDISAMGPKMDLSSSQRTWLTFSKAENLGLTALPVFLRMSWISQMMNDSLAPTNLKLMRVSLRGVANLFFIRVILMIPSFSSPLSFWNTSKMEFLDPRNWHRSRSLTSQVTRSTAFLFFLSICSLRDTSEVIRQMRFSVAKNSTNLEIYLAYLMVLISFWLISGMSVFFVRILATVSLKFARFCCCSCCCFRYSFELGSSADTKDEIIGVLPVQRGKQLNSSSSCSRIFKYFFFLRTSCVLRKTPSRELIHLMITRKIQGEQISRLSDSNSEQGLMFSDSLRPILKLPSTPWNRPSILRRKKSKARLVSLSIELMSSLICLVTSRRSQSLIFSESKLMPALMRMSLSVCSESSTERKISSSSVGTKSLLLRGYLNLRNSMIFFWQRETCRKNLMRWLFQLARLCSLLIMLSRFSRMIFENDTFRSSVVISPLIILSYIFDRVSVYSSPILFPNRSQNSFSFSAPSCTWSKCGRMVSKIEACPSSSQRGMRNSDSSLESGRQ